MEVVSIVEDAMVVDVRSGEVVVIVVVVVMVIVVVAVATKYTVSGLLSPSRPSAETDIVQVPANSS